MSRLKELRLRKTSIQATKKITSAMKMIAASKFKKAQDDVEKGRPYSDIMHKMIGILLEKTATFKNHPPLLFGRGRFNTRLLIVMTSDRGLCGGFNASIIREAQKVARRCLELNHCLKIICVGKRAQDLLKKEFGASIVETFPCFAKPRFEDAQRIAEKILNLFESEEIDVCEMVYNTFVSVLVQKVKTHVLIPFEPFENYEESGSKTSHDGVSSSESPPESLKLSDQFLFEPNEEKVMQALLKKNLAVQIYRALMESAASEQGARMTAMDNATRNASDMIKTLELQYNRGRQAYITKELIEIISGAEAL